jgi:hypothetical protein
MSRIRTYGKWVLALVILFVFGQSAFPYLCRNRHMRGYLLAHLESSFGRPVQARDFSLQLLPWPRLDVDGVTISENPAFGQEYFLRADHLAASVRWLGLLRGHFEFGTISLSRPSLILVRNQQGRWNLEGWLPPAATRPPSQGIVYGPQSPVTPANHLQKIEFDEGRINFKTADEKRPFAFTNVSGSVEQTAPGRWQLRLEAQPWRSGVALQSTGTLQVRGEVAGTSARLQPAEIQAHWGKVSIADLFRMVTGNDSGVRGEFVLDGTASIGKPTPGEPPGVPGSWKFSVHARAARIHRWDLTERTDNPGFSLNLKGVWDVLAGEARADSLILDLPQSHFEGAGSLHTAGMSSWKLQIDDAGIDAKDALAWYRAFQPDVAESLSAKQFFKARFALHGSPLAWDDAEISSYGGELSVPGLAKAVRVGAVQGSTFKDEFQLLPVHFLLDGVASEAPESPKTPKAKSTVEVAPSPSNQLELRLSQDFARRDGSLALSGKVSEIGALFKTVAAFGLSLNHGWELTGAASGNFGRDWSSSSTASRWNGTLSLVKAQLQAAGLNQPLKLDDVRANWNAGRRSVNIARADAFGAIWSGLVDELPTAEGSSMPQWKFQLHADHLDAAELDRWFGPRARPGWLQRLLPSLLGKSDSNPKPSELLRRVSAEGDLTADSLKIEKINLARARAHVVFRDLHLGVTDADAEWAGGIARGRLAAVFSVPPQYEASIEVDRASLSQFPWNPRWSDRWDGLASGKIHFTTSGVGRDALIAQLTGSGELQLKSLELHGWDVPASLESQTVRDGVSHWASGEGDFAIKDRAVRFDAMRLENVREKTQLSGTFHFTQDLSLTFAPLPGTRRASTSVAPPRLFHLAGTMDSPVASIEAAPEAEARKLP